MLVVKVELWPLGREASKREIGRLDIWNKGPSYPEGDYGYKLYKDGEVGKVIKEGTVEGFDRYSNTAYDLVFLVLDEALVGEYESGWLERLEWGNE